MLLNIATINAGIKCKPFLVSEKVNIINLVGTPNNSHNKITEKQGIPLRKVADTILGRSDTGENVLKLLQITQIYVHLISYQKKK